MLAHGPSSGCAWRGEGGAHTVVTGGARCCAVLGAEHTVLRVPKTAAAAAEPPRRVSRTAAAAVAAAAAAAACTRQRAPRTTTAAAAAAAAAATYAALGPLSRDPSDPAAFAAAVVAPLVGAAYLVPGARVRLTAAEARAVASSSRRSPAPSGESRDAVAYRDATRTWLPPPPGWRFDDSADGDVCLEFKPKAPHVSASAFVEAPFRHLKAHHCRADLTAAGKPAAARRGAARGHRPADFFAGAEAEGAALTDAAAAARLRASLEAMLAAGPPHGAFFERGVRNTTDAVPADVLEAVARVLEREPLRHRLARAQRSLDRIDDAGAAAVADELAARGLAEGEVHRRLAAARLEPSRLDCPVAAALADAPDRAAALARTRQLSTRQLVGLLRDWLVGVALADVSILVCVRSVSRSQGAANAAGGDEADARQTAATAGVLSGKGRACAYTVALIDAGHKPPSKVHARAAAHPGMCRRAAAVLGGGGGTVLHRGGCHCGAVRFEFEGAPFLSAWRCNCTICAMKRNDHVVVPATKLVVTGEEHLSYYTFGTHAAQHLFCRVCGICSHYVPRSNPDGYGVSVACIDPGTVVRVELKDFDGRNWERSFGRTGIGEESKA